MQIENVKNFCKKLNSTCSLAISILKTYIKDIFNIIQQTIILTQQSFTQPKLQNDKNSFDSIQYVNESRLSQVMQGQKDNQKLKSQRPTARKPSTKSKRKKRLKNPAVGIRESVLIDQIPNCM